MSIAVEKASEILERTMPKTAVSLNIDKRAALRSGPVYVGTYIDNLFSFAETALLATATQRAVDKGFEEEGLPLSQQDDAVCEKQWIQIVPGERRVGCVPANESHAVGRGPATADVRPPPPKGAI